MITPDQEAVTSLALDALRLEPIWTRNHGLVEILYDGAPDKNVTRAQGCPTIRPIPPAKLVARMSAKAEWVRQKGDGYVRCCVPPYIGNVALAQGTWSQFDDLRGVTETPMLRPDGTIIDAPGYDRATGYFYAPNAEYPAVKADATREDALESVGKLLALVEDFPFAKPEHKSAWLAGLLTPFTRAAFSGCVPAFFYVANAPGTGKSRLASISGMIFLGREFARCPQTDDPEEDKKRITSILLEGDRMVLMDNVTRFGGPVMDALLTSPTWKDRVLGASKTTGDLPVNVCIYVTGNNPVLIGDVDRRICNCALETLLENPEDRRDFKIPNLELYVKEHRAELASHCLTILRAYCAAGRPKHNLAPWGSFEEWSAIVREAIVWLGLPDCAETRKELRAAGSVAVNAIAEFLLGWVEACELEHGRPLPGAEVRGITSAQAETLLKRNPDSMSLLRGAIAELGAPKKTNSSPTSREIGTIIRTISKRVIKNMRICSVVFNHVAIWTVETVGAEGICGDVGICPATRNQKSYGDINIGKEPDGHIPTPPHLPSSPNQKRPVVFHYNADGEVVT